MHQSSRMATRLLMATLLTGGMIAPTAEAQRSELLSRADLKKIQASFEPLADTVKPSVVAIRTYGGQRILTPMSNGSGVIIRSNGFILTNFHVIEGAPNIDVILHDGAEHTAVVIQEDRRSDLAVIKIDVENLKAAEFQDLEEVRVGQWAFAVGHPFGLSRYSDDRPSFTVGNISAIGRNLTHQLNPHGDARYYGNLIETSAAINPGNSGGPLFNVDGKVIGIVTAIETQSGVSEGLGFSIPISSRTRKIVDSLVAGDEVRYGFLGVSIEDGADTPKFKVGPRRVRGARIDHVEEFGPARRAGLLRGDVLVEFDGIPIENQDHIVRVIGATPVGSAVDVLYVRGGRDHSTTIVVDERTDTRAVSRVDDVVIPATFNWRGALLGEIPPALMRRARIGPEETGLLVVDVRPGSDAASKGLEKLQLVKSVNGQRVRTLEQFLAARQSSSGTVNLQLFTDDVIRFPLGAD